MKNFTRMAILALMIAVVMPSCKKYEEGPTLSLRSKTARLVNEWKIEKVLINAIDVSATYNEQYTGFVMNIKDNNTVVFTYTDNNNEPVTWEAQWDFNSDKTGLIITTNGIAVTHEILRLKNDELWLKQTYTVGSVSTITEIHYVTNE